MSLLPLILPSLPDDVVFVTLLVGSVLCLANTLLLGGSVSVKGDF